MLYPPSGPARKPDRVTLSSEILDTIDRQLWGGKIGRLPLPHRVTSFPCKEGNSVLLFPCRTFGDQCAVVCRGMQVYTNFSEQRFRSGIHVLPVSLSERELFALAGLA